MIADVQKTTTTVRIETGGDPSLTDFTADFAKVTKLLESLGPPIGLKEAYCHYEMDGKWSCLYTFFDGRTASFVTKVNLDPMTTLVTFSGYLSDLEHSSVEAMHDEIEVPVDESACAAL
jgi:hypothetical protein